MILNLEPVFACEGESVLFDEKLDLTRLDISGGAPFQTPVGITGSVANRAGVVSLKAKATYQYHTPCDRCAEPFVKQTAVSFSHVLVTELAGEDAGDMILCPGGMLDLSELMTADILLHLPMKFLCRKDCKGLCQSCGGNLNKIRCDCGKANTDPRLDKLSQFFH